MKIEVTKKELIHLVRGVSPSYDTMPNIPKDLGHYVGGFIDNWVWSPTYAFEKYSEKELLELYNEIK